MKKSNLITGILYVLFGVACLIVALLIETKLEGILWGFAGAGIFPGIMMICKYFYWSSPKNKERYEERLENERIEQHDELKTKIRDRAGRYTYSLGLLVVCFSILVFGILGALEVIDNARMIVLYLSGYLLFQVIAGIVIFKIPLGTKGCTSILSCREYRASCEASFPVSRRKLLDRACFVTSFRQGGYTPLRRLCVYPLWTCRPQTVLRTVRRQKVAKKI